LSDTSAADPDARVAEGIRVHGWARVPGYAPPGDWQGLAAEARRMRDHGAFRHAGVGRGAGFRVRPEVRSDHVLWIDPDAATRRQRAWLSRMEALRRALNERLWLGLFTYEAHLAVYPPGAFYATHLDRFEGARHRLVTVILYLNEAWSESDGGALRVFLDAPDPPPFEEVRPEGGTLVAFLSGEHPHEVLPAHRERWSVVGWFTGRE